jgi:two-component system cell cycle sensor histidine kinase/response regulator CckA
MSPSPPERKREEEATQALIEVIRLAAPGVDGHELMRSVLEHVREWAGCQAAGVRLRDNEDYPYYEVRGFPAEFVRLENSLCVTGPDGVPLRDPTGSPVLDCMCGNVLSSRFDPERPFFTAAGSFWTNSTTELLASTAGAEWLAHARNRCNREGYESVALVPLQVGGEIIGLLQLNDRRRNRFTLETITRVEQVAGGIAVVLAERQAQEALRLVEEKHRALFAQSLEGIVLATQDGRILEANPAACAMFGMTEDELRLARREDLVVLDPGFAERLAERERTGRTIGEMTFIRRDGGHFPVEFTSLFLLGADGSRSSLLTFRDITERRQVEENYRTLFREMLDGFALHEIICDEQGIQVDYRFLAINPAFERMTGLKAEEIVGRTVLEVLPGTERRWIETYGKVALTGTPVLFEDYHELLGKHFHVTAYQPGPHQFATIFVDITERKRAEEALRASEAKTRGILDNIRVGVALISPEMEVLDLNPLMREWFPNIDLRQRPICYRAFHDPPRETACDNCPTWKTLHDGLVHETTTHRLTVGGVHHARLISSPIFDASGEVTAVIEMVEDVTERLALEQQLQQAQKMESVGRLAGGVAHDFNNMLGVILGHAEMALEQTDPAQPVYADLAEIRKAAERSSELTRQLLAFARKQTVAPRVLDLNEAVAGMFKMLERLIGEAIDLDWRPGTDLWPVKVDPSQVGQILTNLCVNARDAIADVGRVAIATRNTTLDPGYCASHAGAVPGEYVELAVSDNGCGIDKETMAKLFEPFFTTKDVGEGTGLGLATVYGIVKQNKGFVEVESEPGEGSTFTVYLPRHAAGAEQIEMEGAPVPAARGRETILLVEDEPAILKLATKMLESKGYTVVAASTPGEAIHLAREHRGEIHLLVTDVVMPEMNGRDLAKNVLSLYPQIRRLFMSGYTSDVIAHQGVLEEGVHFLQKPFSAHDLAAQVRLVLDGRE